MRPFTLPHLFLLPALLRPSLLLIAATSAEDHLEDNGLFSFKSRPDLRAPKWDIEVYDHSALAPGSWFFGPYETLTMDDPGHGWIGPHIYAQDGSLVWSGAAMFDNGNIEDFRISQVGDEQMMTVMDQRHGKGVFIDSSFKERYRREAGGPEGKGFNSHEFHFVENGTKALVVWTHAQEFEEKEVEAAGLDYEGKCSVACDGIHEWDVKSWKSSWQWNSCDHIGLEESSYKTQFLEKQCGGRWDYVHANSVDKTPEGDYLYSARHTNTIYKISKDNGTIIWRLVGSSPTTNSSFTHKDDFAFSRQHDVRYRGANATHAFISFLDNAKGLDGNDPTHPFSRGLLIALNEKNMEAEIAAHYDHPDGDGGLAFRRGNYQPLDNGNVFMCWSERALQSEHSADGKMLMQSRLRVDWLGTYRGYKFEFVGTPADPPDAVGEAYGSEKGPEGCGTDVWVSWNGATEVKSYNLYKTHKNGRPLLLVDTQTKNGFETKLSYRGYAPYVLVKALAANNTVLGQTKVIKIDKPKPSEKPDSGVIDDKPEDEELPEDELAADPYWYSDIVFYAFSALLVGIIIAIPVWLVHRRRSGTGGRSGPRRSILDLLWRGGYTSLRDDDRELQEREGKDSLLNGNRRRRGSDDDVFADQFSLGSGEEDSDAEDVEGGNKLGRLSEGVERRR